MSNQTVSVPTGTVPTLINSGLSTGAIIYNTNSKNTVWISSDPSITAGTGIPLNGLGSLTWKGGAVYAVADNGVTTGTLLNISSDVDHLDNPVAIGSAVAAQLLAGGVPSVLIGKTVFSGPIPMPSPGNSWILPVTVGQYASIILLFTSSVNQSLTVSWLDSATGQTVAYRRYMMAANPTDANTLQLELPVKSDQLKISFTNYTAGSVTLNAYASNRSLVERVAGAPPYYQSVIANFAYAAYQSQTFPVAFYSAGGMHTVHLTPNGGGAAGYFGMIGVDANGNDITLALLDSSLGKQGSGTETEINANIVFPAGNYRLYWQNGGTAQTYQTTINITPTN